MNWTLGYPVGVLKNWAANGNGALIAWDAVTGQPKIAVEEVQAKDGWRALAYNGTTKNSYRPFAREAAGMARRGFGHTASAATFDRAVTTGAFVLHESFSRPVLGGPASAGRYGAAPARCR